MGRVEAMTGNTIGKAERAGTKRTLAEYRNALSPREKKAGMELTYQLLDRLGTIPRPSGNEGQVNTKLLAPLASEHGLEYKEDATGNALLTLAATEGFEQATTLLLTAHKDMVCKPNAEEDPSISPALHGVQFVVEEDEQGAQIIRAERDGKPTSAGLDNGLMLVGALAMMVRLKQEGTPHGEIKLLITNREEVDMGGAAQADFPELAQKAREGKILAVNLDSEDGDLTIGSAGGGDTTVYFPYKQQLIPRPLPYELREGKEGPLTIDFSLTGLHGGHSGAEIHIPHLSGVKLTGEILQRARSKGIDVRIISLHAGQKEHNAIPQQATARLVLLNPTQAQAFQEIIDEVTLAHKNTPEGQAEPNLAIAFQKVEDADDLMMLTSNSTQRIADFLVEVPEGVLENRPQDNEFYPVPVTSTNPANAVITGDLLDGAMMMQILTRSEDSEKLEATRHTIEQIARTYGAEVEQSDSFPAWKPDPENPAAKLVQDTQIRLHGKPFKRSVTHGGLEASIFLERFGIPITSTGPILKKPHTTDEHAYIDSATEMMEVLLELPTQLLMQQAA